MKRNQVRANARRKPHVSLVARCQETGEELGVVADIHLNGLCLRSRRGFAVDEVLLVEIAMPKGARCAGPVRAEARRAWSRELSDDGLAEVGFAFDRVESTSSAALAELTLRYSG